MTKGNRKYIIVLSLCFIGLILIQLLAPKPINWNLSYSGKDKIPYGASALHASLPYLFPEKNISDKPIPLYNSLNNTNYNNTNYIFINQKFAIDKLDVRKLFDFVKKGNSAFIAANYFDSPFSDSLKIKIDNFFDRKVFAADSDTTGIYTGNEVRINFVNPSLKKSSDYIYLKGCENTYFTSFDTSATVVLGKNSGNQINFISVYFGKGRFYISTVPEAFSNYHFVNKNNYDYACKALSYLPVQTVFWDEYYKAGNVSHESPLRVIFNNPALFTAYYVLIISLLLFMVIGIKRKQRAIPVISPLTNTTLQFVDIVGTLYYQTGNHKNIADKKITYFLEYIRTVFQIKTTIFDNEFIERISNLSGIENEKINNLFNYFSEITSKQKVTQEELLKLNKLIEEFYTLNKR